MPLLLLFTDGAWPISFAAAAAAASSIAILSIAESRRELESTDLHNSPLPL